MKIIISESQYNMLLEQSSNLTVPEQTLLGFLNLFLMGQKGEFENMPIDQLKKDMIFNTKTIYPMAVALMDKKNTGKKNYNDATFNALFNAMNKVITKDQAFQLYNDAANLTKIQYIAEY